MLQKRRDLGSIPDGLGTVTEDIVKGSLVVRKISADGEVTLSLPTSAEDVKNIYGFATLRIDDHLRTEKFYDTIEKGSKAVVYTLVKNNEWATTQFVGEPKIGDKLTVAFTAKDKGKLVAVTSETPMFEVVNYSPAMGGYEDALLTVRVL